MWGALSKSWTNFDCALRLRAQPVWSADGARVDDAAPPEGRCWRAQLAPAEHRHGSSVCCYPVLARAYRFGRFEASRMHPPSVCRPIDTTAARTRPQTL
eukprot:265056-Prymnesium_polylepis.1